MSCSRNTWLIHLLKNELFFKLNLRWPYKILPLVLKAPFQWNSLFSNSLADNIYNSLPQMSFQDLSYKKCTFLGWLLNVFIAFLLLFEKFTIKSYVVFFFLCHDRMSWTWYKKYFVFMEIYWIFTCKQVLCSQYL